MFMALIYFTKTQIPWSKAQKLLQSKYSFMFMSRLQDAT
jgi:hypothetical protein